MTRLPVPGQDSGQWGRLLNEFLLTDHNDDGTHKQASIQAVIPDGSITSSQLSNPVQTTLSNVAQKADDTTVVHVSGNETINGTKTFSGSPVIPAPSSNNAAVNKTYVDTAIAGVTSSGGSPTNLAASPTSTDVTVASSTGTSAIIAAATTTLAGVMTGVDKTKLAGIANGATTNASDATLLSRANHTGTQVVATLSDFTTSVDSRADARITAAAKANDSAVVHNTGTETIDGVKTFSNSPLVPITPTTSAQVASKAYVDSVAGSGSTPDADAATKGKVQLAGDLTGTAVAPRIANDAVSEAKLDSGVRLKLNSGSGGTQNVFISSTAPTGAVGNYMWIQTGLGSGGTDMTFWVEDGQ